MNGRVVFEFAEATVNRHGYTCCGLHQLHCMVAIAFGVFDEERHKGLVVMHKNDDKQDNRLENLRIGTYSDNAHKNSPLTIYIVGKDPQTFRSVKEAARETGIHLSTIHRNMKRNREKPDDPQPTTTRGPSPITFTAV